MRIRRLLALVTSMGFGMAISTAASADTWSALDLGNLGGNRTQAWGINASGQVVGFSEIGGTPTFPAYINGTLYVPGHAFITGANGVGMTDLGTFGGTDSYAFAINAIGQVGVVSFSRENETYLAHLTGANGVGLTDLGTLGGNGSESWGINASGQVVPRSLITGNGGWSAANTDANGVNASGQVVGDTLVNGTSHAFITGANGVGMTDLGTLGGSNSFGLAINASGQVVGISYIASNAAYHAFITGANGVGMTDLNSLVTLGGGDYFMEARAINDLGQISANSAFGHAYLLSVSAVPEPESIAMLLSGVGLVGFTARRRKTKRA